MKPLIKIITIIGLLAFTLLPGHAEEDGGGHYAIGGAATLIDLLPAEPGFILQPIYLYYEGDASASQTFPIAGRVTTDLDAKLNSVTLGALYTFDKKILGAHYSVGVYVPYIWKEVTARLSSAFGGGQTQGQSRRYRGYHSNSVGACLEEGKLAVQRGLANLCTHRVVRGRSPRKSRTQLLDV